MVAGGPRSLPELGRLKAIINLSCMLGMSALVRMLGTVVSWFRLERYVARNPEKPPGVIGPPAPSLEKGACRYRVLGSPFIHLDVTQIGHLIAYLASTEL